MNGLLGQGWEDPRSSAVMALAGGLLQGNFGGGLLGANQAYGDAKQGQFKQKLLDAQYQETLAQADERKQKLARAQQQAEFDRQFFGMGGAAAGPAAAPGLPGAPGGGMPGAPGAGFTAQQISQQFGVPMEAVIADYRFNGGKKIAELIAERSKPNWMNVNGNLVNTNQPNFQGGLQAGMSAGRDGQVTAWQPDGRGGVVVGAPQGAFETYGRYQGIAKGTEAAHALEKVVGPDGAERFVPRSQVISAAQPQAMPRPTARSNPADADRFAILTQELQRAQASGNGGDVAAIQAEIARLSPAARTSPSPSGLAVQGPFQATPTTAQAAEAAAARVRAEGTARADVERDTTRQADSKRYGQMRAGIDRAIDLLKEGPTASGVGTGVDFAANLFGMSTNGADLASQLSTLSGWLTANTPRMEGPQSNVDVQQYAIMAGTVGDKTKPVSQRLAAAEEVKKLQDKYAELNGYKREGGAEGGWGDQKPPGKKLDTLPKTAPKGQRVRDTTTGEVLVFNGMSWVKEK